MITISLERAQWRALLSAVGRKPLEKLSNDELSALAVAIMTIEKGTQE